MAIIRVNTQQIDEAAYEFVQAGQQDREIPEMCIQYVTDLTDGHDDIIGHSSYVKYGQEFLLNGTTPTGLYAGKSKLTRLGRDANVATWEQTFGVSSVQPADVGRDENPLSRGVVAVERVNGYRRISALMDYDHLPVMNRAGDYMSGFEVEIPTPKYRFKANFATIPAWARDLDGCVNISEKTLPLRQPESDGSLVTVDNITLAAGRHAFDGHPSMAMMEKLAKQKGR